MRQALADVDFTLGEDLGGLFTAHTQEIPGDFLTGLKDARQAQSGRSNEYHHVASIPVVFVHKWLREGLNVYTAPLKDILKKLHEEGLTEFLASDKKVI